VTSIVVPNCPDSPAPTNIPPIVTPPLVSSLFAAGFVPPTSVGLDFGSSATRACTYAASNVRIIVDHHRKNSTKGTYRSVAFKFLFKNIYLFIYLFIYFLQIPKLALFLQQSLSRLALKMLNSNMHWLVTQ
jgi:hypothetical protein